MEFMRLRLNTLDPDGTLLASESSCGNRYDTIGAYRGFFRQPMMPADAPRALPAFVLYLLSRPVAF